MRRTTVFGLDVWADDPLPYLQGARTAATGRSLDVLVEHRGVDVLEWPHDGELISAQLQPDGTVGVGIEAHEEAGYLLWGPGYGRHLLSADGRRLRCVPEPNSDGKSWQRFLIGQVLPFASALHGLEVLHASAVALPRGVLALLGPSCAGKTSLALALARRGATFHADDVLAVERDAAGLLCHPGSPLAGITHSEAAQVPQASVPPPETVAVNERERLVRIDSSNRPQELFAALFLERGELAPPKPSFQPLPDARLLLGSTFNFVLDDPTRLERLLDVCALAAQGTVERVSFGPGTDSGELADAVLMRLTQLR